LGEQDVLVAHPIILLGSNNCSVPALMGPPCRNTGGGAINRDLYANVSLPLQDTRLVKLWGCLDIRIAAYVRTNNV